MSNTQQALEAYNNQKNTETGFGVLNAFLSVAQGHGENNFSHAVMPGDMVFADKHNQFAPKGKHQVAAFASLNDVLHYDESSLKFLGIARGVPEHQGRHSGVNSGQFAIRVGGTGTMFCNSSGPISKMATLAWRIPKDMTVLPVDVTGAGRVLAEIYEYNPKEAAHDAHRIFALVASVLGGSDEPKSTKHADYASFSIWRFLRNIAFTFALEYQKKKNPAMTDADKQALAKDFGLAAGGDTALQMKMLSAVFQMTYSAGRGVASSSTLAFPLDEITAPEKKKISLQQVDQVKLLIGHIKSLYHDENERIIGYSPSGGIAGAQFDVVLKS
jgi:hypothetical protein